MSLVRIVVHLRAVCVCVTVVRLEKIDRFAIRKGYSSMFLQRSAFRCEILNEELLQFCWLWDRMMLKPPRGWFRTHCWPASSPCGLPYLDPDWNWWRYSQTTESPVKPPRDWFQSLVSNGFATHFRSVSCRCILLSLGRNVVWAPYRIWPGVYKRRKSTSMCTTWSEVTVV